MEYFKVQTQHAQLDNNQKVTIDVLYLWQQFLQWQRQCMLHLFPLV